MQDKKKEYQKSQTFFCSLNIYLAERDVASYGKYKVEKQEGFEEGTRSKNLLDQRPSPIED